jgi:NADPH:quinone reductase-like Zn-dependent oxidoreductase
MALQSAWQAGIGGVAGGSEGLNVLIPGASGGVGVVLLQLVKQAGAHATVTCGERNMELLRGLGADEVLDYRTPEGAAYASPSGRKYHVVLNCAHFVPPASFAPHLQPSAKVVDLTPPSRASWPPYATNSRPRSAGRSTGWRISTWRTTARIWRR